MTSIKVIIKVRPLIQREKDENLSSQWTVLDENTIKSHYRDSTLTFDKIFDETKSNKDIFDVVAKPIVDSAVKGVNGTVFAYGQTSSGKTYCMMGTDDNPGIVPLTIAEIFKEIEMTPNREFLLRVGFIEIYNERVFDLLALDSSKELLKLHDNEQGEVTTNLTERILKSAECILKTYADGNANRKTGETGMNDQSSRSHSIFRIVIESKEQGCSDGTVQFSTLNLVDLAGSERADQTKATGERLREGGHINKSLLALSKVIRELSDLGENREKIQYINYRDSKLTRLLSASLGGNAKTAIICTITPASLEETLSTLNFAGNAKKIKNQPKVNETISNKVIMNRLLKDIEDLKKELERERNRNAAEAIQHRLEQKIGEREFMFIHAGIPQHQTKEKTMNRRRTWMCPSISNDDDISNISTTSSLPTPSLLSIPPPPFFVTSWRDKFAIQIQSNTIMEEEEFLPSDEVNLDRTLSPGGRTTDDLVKFIHTPRGLKTAQDRMSSPLIGKTPQDPYERIAELESELEELKDFKFVEERTVINDEDVKKMQEKIKNFNEETNKLESQIGELNLLVATKNEEIQTLKSLEVRLQLAENESKKAHQERQRAEGILSSIQYELDVVKTKAKSREQELVASLSEAWDQSKTNELTEKIKSLEEKLKKSEEEVFVLESGRASNDGSSEKRLKELENEIQLFREDREKMKQIVSDQEKKIKELISQDIKSSEQIMEQLEESEKYQEKINALQKQIQDFAKLQEENEKLQAQADEHSATISRLEKVEQALTSKPGEQEFADDDDIGKLIVRLLHNAAKTETLEVEKLQLMKDLDEIRATVFNLSEELVAAKESGDIIEQLKRDLDGANAELNEARNQLENQIMKSLDCEETIDELQQKIEDARRENSHLVATLKECETFETEVETLTKQKAERDAKIEELLEQIKNSEVVLDATAIVKTEPDCGEDETMKSLENHNKELQYQIENLETQIKTLESKSNATIAELSEKLNNASVKEEELRLEINSLSDEIINYNFKKEESDTMVMMEQQISIIRAEKEFKDDEIQKLQREFEEKNEIISKLESEIAAMKENYDAIESEKNELESAKEELTSKCHELSQQLATLGEKNQIIGAELIAAQAQMHTIEQQKRIIETLTQELADYSSQIAGLVKEAEGFDTTVDKFEVERMEKDAKIENLVKEIQTISCDRDEKAAALCELENKLAQMNFDEDQKQQLEDKVKALENENEILEMQNKQLGGRIQQLEEKFVNSNVVIEELKHQLKLNQSSISELSEKLSCASTAEKSLHDEISALKDQLKQAKLCLEQETNTKEEQIEKFTRETQEKDEIIALLESKLKSLEVDKESHAELKDKCLQLDATVTNRESQILIKEEQIQKLEKDLNEINIVLIRKEAECEEAKTRLRRRSMDNDKKLHDLEARNNELMQQLGEVEVKRVSVENELKQLKSIGSDNDMKFAILDEKYSQLSEVNNSLEAQIKTLKASQANAKLEIDALNAKLSAQMSDNFTQAKTVGELREKCEILTQQLKYSNVKRISLSPNQATTATIRRSNELVEDESFALQHKKLFIAESASGTPNRTQRNNFERKTRRQSVYDESRRRLSVWEQFQNTEVQTDPTNELCACGELQNKVKQLNKEVKVRDIKIANFERLSKANPLKVDLKQAQTELEREKAEHAKVKESHAQSSKKIQELNEKILLLAKNQKRRVEHVTRGVQLDDDDFVEKTNYDNLESEKFNLERKVNDSSSEKENINQNIAKTENTSKSPAPSEQNAENGPKPTYEDLEKKYQLAKRLCSIRHDAIVKLAAEKSEFELFSEKLKEKYEKDMTGMHQSYEMMKRKYEHAKGICENRLARIKMLHEKYEGGGETGFSEKSTQPPENDP